jgi:hypothetical protein
MLNGWQREAIFSDLGFDFGDADRQSNMEKRATLDIIRNKQLTNKIEQCKHQYSHGKQA